MTEPNKKPKLKPAHVDMAEQRAYMPRIPWAWIALTVAGVGTIATGYSLKQQQRADQLRAQIVRVHERELAPAAEKVLAFRDRLDTLIQDAGAREPERFIDERLKLAGLRSGQGLYLRLRAQRTDTPAHIRTEAASMQPDAITRCLGLTAASARSLYEQAAFLEPAWLDAHRHETSVMKLRVTDEMLAQHIRADLPAVLGLLKSDWFMLVVQQGDDRHAEPVDVFLWDLRSGDKLLSARIQARGALLPTRIISQGKPVGAAKAEWRSSGAQDCSIAAQVRALGGFAPAEVHSELPKEAEANTGEVAQQVAPESEAPTP